MKQYMKNKFYKSALISFSIFSSVFTVTAGQLYVDALKGNDSNAGRAADSPLKTIQSAVNLTEPGDTITIGSGVYVESPVIRRGGTESKPVIIKADRIERGRVIISGADPVIRQGKVKWQLEDPSLQLYSIPLGHNPARVLYSGTDLMPFPNLDCLKHFYLLQQCPSPRHGFFYVADEHKLYVRLHPDEKYGSADPNKHLMCVAPPNAPGFNGEKITLPKHANLTVDIKGPAHIVIDGITFETPGATGVLSWASQVTVSNCWFDGCRFGVFGGGDPGKLPSGVIVENCLYHHFPAFDDVAELITCYKNTEVMNKYPVFWWHRKGQNNDPEVMKNYETGIAGGIGKDWQLRYNLISNAFEGLSCWGNSWSENLRIYGNVFEKIVDNAIETENHACNVRIYDNVFRNMFEPISWQPRDGEPWPGPVFIYRNLIYADPDIQQLWPWRPSCFKLGASDRNWTKEHMGKCPEEQIKTPISKRFVMVPNPGFLVFNNTVFMPHANLFNTPQPIEGSGTRELVNFRFFNNILVTNSFHKRDYFNGSLIEFYNNIAVNATTNRQTKIAAGLDGQTLPDPGAVKMANPSGGDFSLLTDSPAIGKGTKEIDRTDAFADIGAIPNGKSWPTFPVGPQPHQ